MAKRQEFSFLAYCAASGLCGALSAACCKEAGRPAASPYIAAAMYTAMLALGSTPHSIASSHSCIRLRKYSSQWHRRLYILLGNTPHTMVARSNMFNHRHSISTTTIAGENRRNRKPKRPAATPSAAMNEENINRDIILNNSYDSFSEEEEEESVIRSYKLPYKYIAEVAYDGTRYNGFQLQNASSTILADNGSSSTSTPDAKEQQQQKHENGQKYSRDLKNRTRTGLRHPPPTIQGKLENALTKFLAVHRDELVLQGAGRTDAGVHARGQVVHFYSRRLLEDTDRAVKAVNSLLPEDIRLLSMLRVPLDYNVRFSFGKIYTYDLHLDPLGSDPFTHRYRLCPRIPGNLSDKDNFNFEALSSAAAVFVGTHDFSIFSSKPRDNSKRSPVRTIRRCEIVAAPQFLLTQQKAHGSNSPSSINNENKNLNISSDPLLRIEIEGDGFLYKQVRHMVGAMLAVATGRITPLDISKALADPVSKGGPEGRLSRPGAYVLAEAHGLCLKKVFLPDPGNPDELMYGEQGPVLKRRAELVSLLNYETIDK